MVILPAPMVSIDFRRRCVGTGQRLACATATLVPLAACHKAPVEAPRAPIEVTVTPVSERDTPVTFEFTAQTQSSHEVEIRARVDGFLVEVVKERAP